MIEVLVLIVFIMGVIETSKGIRKLREDRKIRDAKRKIINESGE